MVNKTCFAYKNGECSVLMNMFCAAGRCSFFKTREQYRDDLKKYPPIRSGKHERHTGDGRK